MFQFPGFASRLGGMTGYDSSRVAPFGNPRIKACLTAPRGLSQPTTSFIASWRLGIHQLPLLSYFFSLLHLCNCQRKCFLKRKHFYFDFFSGSRRAESSIVFIQASLHEYNRNSRFERPLNLFVEKIIQNFCPQKFWMEVNGIEPMTSCVQGRRSPSWATPPKFFRRRKNYCLKICLQIFKWA